MIPQLHHDEHRGTARSEVIPMKYISGDNHEVEKEARKPVVDRELIKYGLGIIALLVFVYVVHLLIHKW